MINKLYYLLIPDEETKNINEINKIFKNKDLDILFLGDSHPKFAVNPKYFSNLNVYNFSIATIDYIAIYHNIDILLNKENVKVKNIFIEIDPHNFSYKKFQNTHLKNNKFYRKYYSSEYIGMINNEKIIDVYKKNIIQSYFGYIGNYYNLLTKLKSLILGDKELSYKGWKAGISTLKDDKSIQLRINNTFDKKFSHSKDGYNFFEKTIKLANKNNINIIFIRYPISKDYIELVNKEYYEKYIENLKKIIRKNGIPFIFYDYSLYKNNNYEYFNDPDHLNKKGSELFSKEIFNKYKLEGN